LDVFGGAAVCRAAVCYKLPFAQAAFGGEHKTLYGRSLRLWTCEIKARRRGADGLFRYDKFHKIIRRI